VFFPRFYHLHEFAVGWQLLFVEGWITANQCIARIDELDKFLEFPQLLCQLSCTGFGFVTSFGQPVVGLIPAY